MTAIAGLEAEREEMKKVNKLYKKGDRAGLAALGIDLDELAARLKAAGSYFGARPHMPFELSNLGANIRRCKQRVQQIKRQQARQQAAEDAGGIVIKYTPDPYGPDDWCQVMFAEKPERAILKALKAAGYHWGGGCWTGRKSRLPAEVAELEAAQS